MNSDQIESIIRNVLTGLGSSAVAAGVLTQTQLSSIVGGVVALACVAWGIYSNRHGHSGLAPADKQE
jgi:hypothetical protein